MADPGSLRYRLDSRRPDLRDRRPSAWAAAACVLVYVVVCGPILLAGRVTLSGYLLDGTVAILLLAADHLVAQGGDFSMLPPSSRRR